MAQSLKSPPPIKSASEKEKPAARVRKPIAPAAAPDARRRAAAILEVLAGTRTPTEAAKAIGVTVPRYYALEARAIEGLVAACEPRARGPGRSLERELAGLRKEAVRLERECTRSQALARTAQRTLGLLPTTTPKTAGTSDRDGKSPSEKKRRARRPVARALRAAAELGRSPAVEPGSVGAAAAPAAPSSGRGE